MARNKNKNNNTYTTQEKSFRKIRIDDLLTFNMLTANQKIARTEFNKGNNLFLHGCAGTGKTFLGLYFALEQVLDPASKYEKLVIFRSAVPTRSIGFLKGDKDEKVQDYELPYIELCAELFGYKDAYAALKDQGKIEFEVTSFVRGRSVHNSIILVDESENLNFHELDSVITRIGDSSRIILSGDYLQSDFTKEEERNGILTFTRIMKELRDVSFVEFGVEDIVRSAFVKAYIQAKLKLGIR